MRNLAPSSAMLLLDATHEPSGNAVNCASSKALRSLHTQRPFSVTAAARGPCIVASGVIVLALIANAAGHVAIHDNKWVRTQPALA